MERLDDENNDKTELAVSVWQKMKKQEVRFELRGFLLLRDQHGSLNRIG